MLQECRTHDGGPDQEGEGGYISEMGLTRLADHVDGEGTERDIIKDDNSAIFRVRFFTKEIMILVSKKQ